MRVLALETSCDETAAAVVDDQGNVLSDVVHSQIAIHAPYGGIIPELASRDHLRNAEYVVREALARAGIVDVSSVDGIAVTCRPGLVGALLVGVQVAKALAFATDLPFVGVDHLVGHLLAVRTIRPGSTNAVPAYPYLALLVSGGHTALYRVDGPLLTDIREIGATRDDAAGEAYDKTAKLLGLGYPGGPTIDRLAHDHEALAAGDRHDEEPFTLPMLRGFEFSFSGLKTQVAQRVAKQPEILKNPARIAALCAAFQEAMTRVLVQKLFLAAEAEDVTRVVIGGGVAANRGLRARILRVAKKRNVEAYLPDLASCTDNAAMIGYAGAMRLVRGERDTLALCAESRTSLPRTTRKGRGERV